MKETIRNANFPRSSDGATYHVGTKPGQVANRIIQVGDPARAKRIAEHLDSDGPIFEFLSHRGFLTITGLYKGVPVSLIGTGMGYPLVDFMVRETRATIEGDLLFIRFGSCGAIAESLPVASIVVPDRAFSVIRHPDHWHGEGENRPDPYIITSPIKCDKILHDNLAESLSSASDGNLHITSNALHASADSFYSSQGRIDTSFPDENQDLLDNLLKRHPDLATLEMETSHLFDLAAISTRKPSRSTLPSTFDTTHPKAHESGPGPNPADTDGTAHDSRPGVVRAAAVHMVFAGRRDGSFISPEVVQARELYIGKACLEALARTDIPEGRRHPDKGSVWCRE